MKRLLFVLSMLCLLITFFPGAVSAETYENMTYTVAGGAVTITDCAPSATGKLTIPATIDGYPVTTIAMSAFADCTGLTDVTVGKNVTSVGTGVFSGCTGLSAITVAEGNPVYHSAGNCLIETSSKTVIAGCKNSVIPTDGSVTAIDRLAFYKCNALTAITIPDSIVSVGASAFEGCSQLADVTIGKGVTSIGNSAFWDCTALTEIIIPDSVTTMGVYVFCGCTGLTSVTIGEKVTVVGNSVFSGCAELAEVSIGSSVATIDIFAFSGCSKLTDISIPSSVTTIGKFAFYNCGQLESIQISESISTIGSNAFAGCTELKLLIDEDNAYAISYAQKNGIAYAAYGIGSLAVTTVTLRPGVAGVYFKSNLDWAEHDPDIRSYGIAVSVYNPLPVADGSDKSSLCAQGGTSVLIKNVMKTENSSEVNTSRACTPIYARVYVQLSDGQYVYSEPAQVTLQWVVTAAQNNWETLSTIQKDAMKQMYNTYYDVMRYWNVPNLKTA